MKRKDSVIGQIFCTNEGYDIKIIDYITRHDVLVCFVSDISCQLWTTLQNIKHGQVKYPYHRNVYGIGYYGEGMYSSRINTFKTPQYVKWLSMFCRCYNDKYQTKEPSYIGCSVSEEFHNFQNFAAWYDRKIYESRHPLELDKDLFIEGNKIYSPSTCCFIPKEINNALKYCRNNREKMTILYNKYRWNLPFQVRDKLLSLTDYERRNDELSQHY